MSIVPVNKGILGKKVGTSQIFAAKDGKRLPVTIVEVGPCVVVQKKSVESDGYACLQLGFQDEKKQRINKPQEGHFKKAGVAAKRHLKEFKFCDEVYSSLKVGDEVTIDQFQENEFVDVIGT